MKLTAIRSFTRFVALPLLFWFFSGAALAVEKALLWKIEPPDAPPSYVFGTIHTDDPRVINFSQELRQALQQSPAFMMEVLPPRDLSVLFMPQGTLRDVLKPHEVEQVLKLADEHAIREDMALRMKPWLLASVFALPRPQSPMTMDIQLFGMAASGGKQVLGLETADEHFGALDGLPLDDQVTLLRVTLAQTPEEKAREFETVVQAYLDKEVDKIAMEDTKRLGALPERLWKEIKRLLLDQRNERMAHRIEQQTAAMPTFIAVGAAHLPGEGGLIERLRKSGYKVTPIQ